MGDAVVHAGAGSAGRRAASLGPQRARAGAGASASAFPFRPSSPHQCGRGGSPCEAQQIGIVKIPRSPAQQPSVPDATRSPPGRPVCVVSSGCKSTLRFADGKRQAGGRSQGQRWWARSAARSPPASRRQPTAPLQHVTKPGGGRPHWQAGTWTIGGRLARRAIKRRQRKQAKARPEAACPTRDWICQLAAPWRSIAIAYRRRLLASAARRRWRRRASLPNGLTSQRNGAEGFAREPSTL
jgi:hypothetical protein